MLQNFRETLYKSCHFDAEIPTPNLTSFDLILTWSDMQQLLEAGLLLMCDMYVHTYCFLLYNVPWCTLTLTFSYTCHRNFAKISSENPRGNVNLTIVFLLLCLSFKTNPSPFQMDESALKAIGMTGNLSELVQFVSQLIELNCMN